ncbi:hypothetical protein BDR04DRAFT_1106318 [Suillus decipiens]|nr:hypothetical protein BDR04DRAFT_1106318 [Suillus decipiens]
MQLEQALNLLQLEFKSQKQSRDEEARELKEQVQKLRDEIQAELGRLKQKVKQEEKVKQQEEKITELERQNRKTEQQKRKIKELEGDVQDYKQKVEWLEEEKKRPEKLVTQNCNRILRLERRSIVNDARKKLESDFGFMDAQLSLSNYCKPRDRRSVPERQLNRAANYVFTDLPRLPHDALRIVLGPCTMQGSTRDLGHQEAHPTPSEDAMRDMKLPRLDINKDLQLDIRYFPSPLSRYHCFLIPSCFNLIRITLGSKLMCYNIYYYSKLCRRKV